MAPMASTITVNNTILNRVEKVLRLSNSLIMSLTIILFLKEEDDLKSKANIFVMVKTPNPPNWISIMMMVCPNRVKSFPVSKMAKPVTVTALVEVNNACIKDTFFIDAAGNIKQNVPNKIKNIKLKTNKVAGWIEELPRLDILNEIDKKPIKTAKNWLNAAVSMISYPELHIQSKAKTKLKKEIIKNRNLDIMTYLFFAVTNKYKLSIIDIDPKMTLSGL